MKLELKAFQEVAVEDIATKVRQAAGISGPTSPQAVVLSAPTGAGKTVIATCLIERILEGDDQADPDPDAVILWITDLPELNQQTYDKMEATSDVLDAWSMEVVSSSFNHRVFSPGRVYFLNTQKLGKDKLLTTHGDGRQYTIWQTVDNTIKDLGSRFIVVIDEAHRGMRTKKDSNAAETIIQKFLIGNDVMEPAPLVVGISATPQRFSDLVQATRTVHPVQVEAADVRESGLLKERIILHHSEDDQAIDITLLRVATRHWLEFDKRWDTYCQDQGAEPVVPIMVVQVENAPKGKSGTRTDLDAVMSAINDELPKPLRVEAFAHAFDESTALDTGNRIVRYLAPSRIASDRDVRVVFFKTALSTGWDCPQAETMMSFRKAKDATYIAQLIGRMVRTPLARRIESDESLNSVALFLPHYDAEGVEAVVERLADPDYEYVPPVQVSTASESVTLMRADGTEAIFDALAKMPSYTVPTRRKVKQVRRLMKMSRALANDGIDSDALTNAKDSICDLLADRLNQLKSKQEFQDKVSGKATVIYGARVYDVVQQKYVESSQGEMATSPENIEHLFAESGRRITEGLHKDSWRRLVGGEDDVDRIRHAKIETAVLLSDSTVLDEVEALAESMVEDWRSLYVEEIDQLAESRGAVYEEVAGTADTPSVTHVSHPKRLLWKKPKTAQSWERHIYTEDDGQFFDDFNLPETETVSSELARDDVIGWLRNVDRQKWSLKLPYQRHPGRWSPVFPDFLFFRQAGDKVVIDILDPHGWHLPEAVQKAVGLSLIAEEHGHRFGRIEVIDKIEGQLLRLDLKDKTVRKQVQAVTTSDGLHAIYEVAGTI